MDELQEIQEKLEARANALQNHYDLVVAGDAYNKTMILCMINREATAINNKLRLITEAVSGVYR